MELRSARGVGTSAGVLLASAEHVAEIGARSTHVIVATNERLLNGGLIIQYGVAKTD
jgi:hypothetical protein